MPYRLIALDLDGTLLARAEAISPRTLAALKAARERGIVAVIATGRTPHSAREYSQQIGGGPVICCNGAAILDERGAYLMQKPIPTDPLLRVLSLCQGAGLLCDCYTTDGVYLDRALDHYESYRRWVARGMGPMATLWAVARLWRRNRMRTTRNLSSWAERPGRPPVLKVMVVGRPEVLAEVAAQVGSQVPGVDVTRSGPDNLEINAAGVSKGTGLEWLGAYLKIARSEMIAFGDSENDLQMLRYAGLGVAMGNAPAQIQGEADRVTLPCDQDGVAAAVEELCLR